MVTERYMACGRPEGKASEPPAPFIARFAGEVERSAAVLDVAAGGGRHSALFLDLGHPVTAVDIEPSGLAWLAGRPGFERIAADLEKDPWPCPDRRFGAVVVVNYLWRPLFPALLEAVLPGGLLLYETFAQGNERFGRPANPDFLLRPGELRDQVKDRFAVLAFTEGEEREPRPAVRQRIAARRLS